MRDLVRAAKALSDETRLRILNLLLVRECCVCEVMQVLEISQTRASRNLNILHDAGFLKLRREGLWAHYSIDWTGLKEYSKLLLEAVQRGLKKDELAYQDREHLKDAERLAPLCGNPSQARSESRVVRARGRND
jgi:ArsR family transcriptional regulator, arsenate/arsenite/antimonite-responsive transcriptional repressor